MTRPVVAHLDPTTCRWVVPVGAITDDEIRNCDYCGHGVNVLTIATESGSTVIADDYRNRADENETICSNCLPGFGE